MNTLTSLLERIRSSFHPDPVRDWHILLAGAGAALGALALWSLYLFTTVASGGIIGTPSAAPAQSIAPSAFDTVHEIFTSREAESTNYRTGVYSFTDPSL